VVVQMTRLLVVLLAVLLMIMKVVILTMRTPNQILMLRLVFS
jgi:hypothetical protein